MSPANFYQRNDDHQAANEQTGGGNRHSTLSAKREVDNEGNDANQQYHAASSEIAGRNTEITFGPSQVLLQPGQYTCGLAYLMSKRLFFHRFPFLNLSDKLPRGQHL